MRNWPVVADELRLAGQPFVIVTVVATRGSSPRDAGARMIVTRDEVLGTIGGGQLEYECTRVACQWFDSGAGKRIFTRRFTLGASLGQCCGGVVEAMFEQVDPARADWIAAVRAARERPEPTVLATLALADRARKYLIGADEGEVPAQVSELARDLQQRPDQMLYSSIESSDKVCVPALFEKLVAPSFDIVVFGAGHVGSALIDTLAPLDCRIRWIDSRSGLFPASLPARVEAVHSRAPQTEIDSLAPGSSVIVMTHSHPQDLAICAAALQRDDLDYCGLIGSLSKRRQFEKRLRKLGLSERQLKRLVCPIGVGGIAGKEPAAIAIGVAAQLLQRRDAVLAADSDQPRHRRKARQ